MGEEEAILYNNGIAEFVLPLGIYVNQISEGLFFEKDEIWEYVHHVVQGYQKVMPEFFGNQRYFGCISIIGCKDVITEANGHGRQNTKIDRNEIVCQPIAFENIKDEGSFNNSLNYLQLEYLLSIGIRRDGKIQELIKTNTGI